MSDPDAQRTARGALREVVMSSAHQVQGGSGRVDPRSRISDVQMKRSFQPSPTAENLESGGPR